MTGGFPVILGIDPDTKTTGLCLWTANEIRFAIARVREGRYARDRAPAMAQAIIDAEMELTTGSLLDVLVVEWQRARPGDPHPDNIVSLGAVAGMCLGLVERIGSGHVFLPYPSEWKGTIPKEIHQRRLRDQLEGFGSLADSIKNIPPSLQTHCLDAFGLCLWARKRVS